MLIIPAVDIKEGKCVRLFKGKFDRVTQYLDDPLEAGVHWERQGARCLHVVDLDGARHGQPCNFEIIKRLLGALGVPAQVGGGVRSREAVEGYLRAGASRIVLGTRAILEPEWLEELSGTFPALIAVSLDCAGERLAVRGWAEKTDVSIHELLPTLNRLDLSALIFTDVEGDGTMRGWRPDLAHYIVSKSTHPVIAAGGIGSLEDIATLREIGFAGAIVGRALYEGAFTLREAQQIGGQEWRE